MNLTPWWEIVRLRDEIVHGGGTLDDVQMSLYQAVHGVGGQFPAYSKAAYYGEITHPGTNLVELMARVAVRLAGVPGVMPNALWRLAQSMGGGKSHGLVGLWHLAAQHAQFRETDIGRSVLEAANRMSGTALPALGEPVVVVLAGDNMTPGRANPDVDGPAVTLHERFLWQLFSHDHTLFQRYQPYHADKAKLADALRAVNQPVLILIDEIMDYVRQLSVTGLNDLATKDMGFLRALMDTVNDVPRVVAVVVMIDSEQDSLALDDPGQIRRAELDDVLTRNGTPTTVTSNTDFGDILRRRLLQGVIPSEVFEATGRMFREAVKGDWRKIFEAAQRTPEHDFMTEVSRCYPFHPMLIELAEREWALQAGFQRVRSTIRIFASTLFALQQRGRRGEWCPVLIGPGDLPLSVPLVREALIGSGLIPDDRSQANYRQVAAADIIGDDERSGSARHLDLSRPKANWTGANPRAAERMATSLFLHSIIGTRAQGRRGATETEVKAAAFVPDGWFSHVEAETVLEELADSETGLAALERIEGRGGQPARLFLSTRKTLTMHFRAARAGVSEADRDAEVARMAEAAITSGPFKSRFIDASAPGSESRPARELLSDIDDRSLRLVVLDHRRYTLLNGADLETREAIESAMGIGRNKLPVSWGPSAVFVVMNTQRRSVCRQHATTYLAWTRVLEIDAVRQDAEEHDQADDERRKAKRDLERAVKRAYQHILFVEQSREGAAARECREIRIEHDAESALDGQTVWQKLVEADRALPPGGLTAKALLANLTEDDYNRPLDETVNCFWGTPRMPLVWGGEKEIRSAIFEALENRQLRLVGSDGVERIVNGPGDVPLQSSALRLALPAPATSSPTKGEDEETGGVGTSTPDGRESTSPGDDEVLLSFALRVGLVAEPSRRQQLYEVFQKLAELAEKEIEHVDLSAKLALTRRHASELSQVVRAAGGNPTETPL